jgi:peptidoglycan/LPS O-acetylase OafA/YrhL
MKRISTYRDALMGMAILWIMLFHAEISLPGWLRPLTWLHETGYGGVDIFLFLSGLGLYYSLSKNPDAGRFYRNRFLRILPTYWAVILLTAVMEYLLLHRHTPWIELFYMLSTAGFWLNATKFDWYIPSILVLYLLFPLFFRMFRGREGAVTALVGLVGVGISLAIAHTRLDYLLIFTTRIPVFFIGAYAGFLIKAGRDVRPAVQWMLLLLGLTALAVAFLVWTPDERWHNGTWWYPFILITGPLCIVLSRVHWNWLGWLGRYSLEIYLVHTLVFGLHKETARYFAFDPSGCSAYGVYILISLPLAWALHQVMGRIIQPLQHV